MASQSLKSRLESLYRHLDEEGWHVHANTVALAIELEVIAKNILQNDGGEGSQQYDSRKYYEARKNMRDMLYGK